MLRSLRWCVIAIALSVFLACSKDIVSVDLGGVSLRVSSSASVADVSSWRVSISGPSGSQTRTGAPGGTIEFGELEPGSYNVLVEGLDGSDVASRGQTNVTVQAGSNATANVSLSPVLPELTVFASDPNASEVGPDPGTFTISRSGPSSSALVVNVSIGGTAIAGVDYQAIASPLTLAPGQRSLSVSVVPILDALQEGNESVMLTLGSGAGYMVAAPSVASVVIADAPLPEVRVLASSAPASEAGPIGAGFRISRTGATTAALSVSVTFGGTATAGSDYQAIETTQTIPVGATFVDVYVAPILDALVEGSETVTLTVLPSGTYTVGAPASATVMIEDAPVVTIVASDPNASEMGLDPGTFTISRTGSTATALTVTVAATGTATSGSDYIPIASTQILPAGAASVTVAVTPLADTLTEGGETVVLSLVSNVMYAVGTPSVATVTIADTPPPVLPVVTVLAIVSAASEVGPVSGTFRISRTGPTSAALPVSITLSGAATAGSDYQTIATTQTIPLGATSVNVTLAPLLDAFVEGNETAVLTIATSTSYTVGTPSSATVTIADAPVLSVVATDANASEEGPDPGTFTISRTGPTTTALIVMVSVSGTATPGSDYPAIPTTQLVPAGAASVVVTVVPVTDTLTEGSETVVLSLVSSTQYALGTLSVATVTIADAPPQVLPVVTVQATDPEASEVGPDPGIFTISRTGSINDALTVMVEMGGTATPGSDYVTITSTQEIPAGAASVTVMVMPLADMLVEGSETVTMTLIANAAYVIGASSSSTVTIADTPPLPTVSVVATDSLAHEAGPDPGLFTISRTGPTTSALAVNFEWLNWSGCVSPGVRSFQAAASPVTIPAGQASIQVPVTVVLDSIYERLHFACLDLQPSASYMLSGNTQAQVRIADALIAREITSGDLHSCARMQQGTAVVCWGNNTFGEQGRGLVSSNPVTTPGNPVQFLAEYAEIEAGNYHTCGRTELGRVDCWGYNSFGQIGNGVTAISEPSPMTVQAPTGVVFSSLAGGTAFTCALSQTNTAFCWGYQDYGRLGNGSANGTIPVPQPTPVLMPSGVLFVRIVAGREHACALTGQGVTYCWGNNSSGQVGNNVLAIPVTQPTQLQTAIAFVELAAGDNHTCGRTLSGDVYCWGSNQYGQLGIGSTGSPIALPTSKANPTGVSFVEISARRGGHTCGRTAAGQVYCWGNNFSGQIGNGLSGAAAPDVSSPILVSANLVFREISTGQSHTCGRTEANVIYCWGSNERGQLGDGTFNTVRTRPTPVEVR